MKKVIIIGGGISGMSCGIYLQNAGFETEIIEKNALPGGECTAWKREGYTIDNCINWLTGTREGIELNKLWKNLGALGDGVELYKKPVFSSTKIGGKTVTLWRDLEKTRREMIEISPEDKAEINKFIDNVKFAESMTVPTEKPFDFMSVFDYIKMGRSMGGLLKVMKEYKNEDIDDLGARFKSPLIRAAVTDFMPRGYKAYSMFISYATVTSGNGDIPLGGSLAMSLRIAEKYKSLGGKITTNCTTEKIIIENKKAAALKLSNGNILKADYIVCACDSDVVFSKLLDKSYMPKSFKEAYDRRDLYPVMSGFQTAFAVDGIFDEIESVRLFETDEIHVGTQDVSLLSTDGYNYQPLFAPEGKSIIQSNVSQTEKDYFYWEKLYNEDSEEYKKVKREASEKIMAAIIKEYPFLENKIHILDTWTPMTYKRYCGAYHGAYMSFVITKGAKDKRIAGKIKGLSNVMLAGQWLMGPGGLPTAAVMGKFAAQRIMKKERVNINV